MFIQQMISLSYDSILNSLSLLFCSYIMKKLYDNGKIKVIDILIPIVYLLISFTVKVVYFPMIILLLLIPKKKFGGIKNKILYLIAIILIVLLLSYLIQDVLFVGENFLNNDVNKQLDYLLNNPLKVFPIAFNTIKYHGTFYLRSLIGLFAWFNFGFSDFTIFTTILYFVLLICSEKSLVTNYKSKINIKKILLGISILVSVAAICGSMYLYWTEYKGGYVGGVQGRYFIPLLIPIAMLFMPKKEYFSISRNNFYMFSNILLLQYIMYAIIYFY